MAPPMGRGAVSIGVTAMQPESTPAGPTPLAAVQTSGQRGARSPMQALRRTAREPGEDMRAMTICLAAAGLLGAGQALAQQAPATARFNVGSVAMDAKLPAGFCEPSGAAIAAARLTAASDPGNATDLTLYPCTDTSGAPPEYFLVKTPRNLLDTAMTREELLKALTAELEDPSFSAEKLSSEANSSASDSVSKASGVQVQVKTDIRPLGRDGECAYMGGVVALTAGSQSGSVNVGGCITAVGNRVVMVFYYRAGSNIAEAAKLLPAAKALAMAITPRP
jgi:hypothetical protein